MVTVGARCRGIQPWAHVHGSGEPGLRAVPGAGSVPTPTRRQAGDRLVNSGTAHDGPVSAVDIADALGIPPPTPEQAGVLTAGAEPSLVVAGAGSGKTETMAARVIWLVARGIVAPEGILGLTFPPEAARQLSGRIRSRPRRLAVPGVVGRIDSRG